MGHYLTALEELDLYFLSDLTDEGIAALAPGVCAATLMTLNLSFCGQLGDGALKELGRCSALKSLEVEHCSLITDGGLHELAQGCHDLERLVLDGCAQITDAGISELKKCCPALHHISLKDCSAAGLNAHSHAHPQLHSGVHGSMISWDGSTIVGTLDWSLLPS